MNSLRDWLTFSKGERVAIISILAIIVALILVSVFRPWPKSLDEKSLHNLDSLLALRQQAIEEQQSKKAESTPEVAELHPFPFNPNTLTEDEWKKIGLTDRQIRKKAEDLLAELGLKGKENSRPSELSGGEQQRVAIARAMINSPKIIFADEPSGNLDSRTKQELHDLFFKMRDSHGQTIVIVTHDESLAKRCDRCLTLKDGVFV